MGMGPAGMALLKILLLCLGLVAGALWVWSAFRFVQSFVIDPSSVTQTASGIPDMLLMSPWIIVWVMSIGVAVRLAPRTSGFAHFNIAMRGAPRPLRWTMWATWFGVLPGSLIVAAITGRYAGSVHGFDAAFFSFSCCVLISGARLGLGEPKCGNGHVIAADMRECSLCGAPAKGLGK
jgi:hypothetical protein